MRRGSEYSRNIVRLEEEGREGERDWEREGMV